MPQSVLVNLLFWQLVHSAARGAARTLQFAPLSFDVSFQEMLSCLCSGSSLVLVREERRRDFAALWKWIGERSVERIFVPFIALQQLAEAAADLPEVPAGLREVVTAGEQLQVSRGIVRLFERSAGARLLNQYGPSETHVVTEWPLPAAPREWPRLPPIGRPISNLQAYVLDAKLQPLPAGIPGELCLGGAGLARGYLGRPESTAEKFVPDPFGGEPGARLYRTGDLARHLTDGDLEFLGRLDHQVKVRGYRIEPGEIEAVLAQHPEVCEGVVLVREDAAGDKRLVAYVVPRSGETLAAGDLRAFLRERLPEYMVPSAFVLLEALPLTPSGKIARRLLPAPGSVRLAAESYVAPRSLLEARLVEIWREVLRAERIGIHDNFFELGGHSLLATQVVSRVRNTFWVDLPLRRLFEAPSVAELALMVVLGRIEGADRQQVDCVLAEVEGLTAQEAGLLAAAGT